MNPLTIKNLIKNFVKNLALLFSEGTLYPKEHPDLISQLRQTFNAAQELFDVFDAFYLDISEGQFIFEGIPLYEIKHLTEKTMQLLETKGIHSLSFGRGLTPQELFSFVQLTIDKTKNLTFDGLQKEMAEKDISKITIQKTPKASQEDEEKNKLQPQKIYGSSIEAAKLIYGSIQQGKPVPMDVVDKIAQDLTRLITKDSAASIALTSLRDYDEYTFTHSTNVAILSVTLATTFIQNNSLLNQLAKAALLHDIGKLLIPNEVLNKPEQLTVEDWKLMRQHPLFGARILEQQGETDKLAILVATQHHMKYDLSGYPNIDGITQLYPLSLIVAICDTYDALTSKRVYKKPLPPDKALAIMVRLIGCDFDPQFFRLFMQMMGIFPPGSFVRLNTQEIALVSRVHPYALLFPEVKIISDNNDKFLDQPTIVDLSDEEENASHRFIKQVIDPADLGIDPLPYLK